MGPGVDNDTRTSSFNKDCQPLLPPRPPKPYNNYIHGSGIPPLATTPAKRTRAEIKDSAGTAKKKARATQQHLDRLGKLANTAKICLYKDHEWDFVRFARQCRGQHVRYSKVAHIRGFFSSYLRFLCPQCIGSF